MRDLQGEEGANFNPALLPDLALQAACCGDLAHFQQSFDPAKHLTARVTRTRLPLTSLVVIGAQRIKGGGQD